MISAGNIATGQPFDFIPAFADDSLKISGHAGRARNHASNLPLALCQEACRVDVVNIREKHSQLNVIRPEAFELLPEWKSFKADPGPLASLNSLSPPGKGHLIGAVW